MTIHEWQIVFGHFLCDNFVVQQINTFHQRTLKWRVDGIAKEGKYLDVFFGEDQ